MDEAEQIAQISLFAMMKKRDHKRIVKGAERLQFQAGETIIREGEKDGCVYIVLSGQVEIVIGLGTEHEKVLRVNGPNTYFGEMAILDNYVRTASVRCQTRTEVLALTQWNIREEIQRHPTIGIEIIQTLSRRLTETYAQID